MGVPAVSRIEEVDTLYVAGLAQDVIYGCRARLARDHAEGLRIGIVTLFDPLPDAIAGALWGAGVRLQSVELPGVRARHPGRHLLDGLSAGPNASDQDCLERASLLLHDLTHRSRARQVYAPLGVGGHPDRRLAHDAARAVLRSGSGRDVFFYEERPESLVRGAVRVRLAQIGARLPPGAAEAADRTPLLPFLMRFHLGLTARGEIEGGGDRLRTLPVAARFWREGRSWQPQRARGPRLQPIVWEMTGLPLAGLPDADRRTEAMAAAYARRLHAGASAERYWLLLPPLAGDGWEDLPLAAGA